MVPNQDVNSGDTVLLPFKTQDLKADQERIESLTAKEWLADFRRECKGQVAGVDRPSNISLYYPAKNISEHKARKVNIPDMEI